MSAGQLFNERYELGLSIGRTGLANAYRAHDRLLDRPVVFQSLLSRHTTDREFVQRFRHQVQAAANLTHPAIVTVLDWGRDPQGIGDQPGPTYFMVTEQVDGRTLVDLVEKEGPVSGATTVRIMIEITSALGYAHRGGVMHGALQPSDIHLTHNGSVRVGDIGLNGALGTAWRPDPDAVEIARWRAPELVLGQDADERTDVYGLGAVGYFALTGKAPFEGTTADEVAEGHLRVIPPAPSKLRAGVPRGLEVIMGRSLAKQRNDRFATMNDLRAALIRFRETLEPRPVETVAPVRSEGAVTPTLAGSTLAGPTSSADPTTGSASGSFDAGEMVPAAASAGSPGPVSPGPEVPSDQAQPRRDRPRRDPTRRDAAGRGGRLPDTRTPTSHL